MEEFDLKKPRKRRAIGYLAQRILDRLPLEPKENERWEITIDQIIKTFDAKKGIVYEVFHVFEGLLLVSKIGKNTFLWNGFKNMRHILILLRRIGVCMNLHQKILETREHEATKLVKKKSQLEILPNEFEPGTPLFDLDIPGIGTIQTAVAQDHEVPVPNKPKFHILTVCQKFLMLFLVADEPKTMSLEFATKVIHGTNLPTTYERARTRRLYDVSNVLLAVSAKYPLLTKVSASRVGSFNRTAFQYSGPRIEADPIDCDAIFNLPEYRKKHLLFDYGKELLKIPIRPESIPSMVTVRRSQIEQTLPWPIDTNHGIDMAKATIFDISRPLSTESLILLECQRQNTDPALLGVELIKALKSEDDQKIPIPVPRKNRKRKRQIKPKPAFSRKLFSKIPKLEEPMQFQLVQTETRPQFVDINELAIVDVNDSVIEDLNEAQIVNVDENQIVNGNPQYVDVTDSILVDENDAQTLDVSETQFVDINPQYSNLKELVFVDETQQYVNLDEIVNNFDISNVNETQTVDVTGSKDVDVNQTYLNLDGFSFVDTNEAQNVDVDKKQIVDFNQQYVDLNELAILEANDASIVDVNEAQTVKVEETKIVYLDDLKLSKISEPPVEFVDDLTTVEDNEIPNTNNQIIEEEAILSEWQIGKDEEIEENYLEGTEIVIDIPSDDSENFELLSLKQPGTSSIFDFFWSLLPNQDGSDGSEE